MLLPTSTPKSGQEQSYGETHSPHGNLNIACQNCHTASGWKPIRPAPEFDHNQTRYPLRGMHEGVACTQCHIKMVFTNVGSKCADCHADIHRRQFGANCEQCHNVRGWNVAVQQINQHQNRFPLIGAHAALECDSCHKGAASGQFTGLSTQCYSCHAKDFQKTNAPAHLAAGFSTTCEQCHGVDNWFGVNFDHLKFTGFALTGAHATLQCNQCHINNQFKGTSANCVSCHLKDFQTTNNPNHVAGGFSQTCQLCHNTASWLTTTFDHNTVGFPLTGAHATVQCAQCHINNNYQLTNTSCVSCHLKDFQGTTNPNHPQQGFSQTCDQCHNTAAWTPAKFDHSASGFPLTGAHASVQCTQCHINNNYNITNTVCVSCHLKDFQGANNPNHVAGGFPQTCQQCHSTASWTTASFDHSTVGFPLTGAHATVQCAQCHVNNNYQLTNTSCVSCHLKDFQGTTNPNHAQQGFSQTCEQCHNTAAWTPAKFDHATSGFPLTGAHANVQCTQCHINNNYAITNTSCVSCHLTDFQTTNNPNHVQANFPQGCEQCHNTTSWGGASFNHASTGFALTGFHATTPCAQCHVNGNYTLNSSNSTCVSCHMTDFKGTNNPSHVQANFPQTCEQCHNTTSWGGATFNHASTGFALTGAHNTLQCTQCHVNGNYALNSTNTTCVSCHMTDFKGTNNPSHVQANFPQTCEQCHTTTSWGGATFNHASTGFALTGFHATMPCTQCHVNGNYALNSSNTPCVPCHMTDFTATTNPSHVSANFPQTCEQCHNTTSWGNGTFNHAATGFALTGMHVSPPTACTACHVNSNYNLGAAQATCANCHMSAFTTTNAPNHTAVGFPQTCDLCHDTVNWMNATFNHNNTPFPLTGYHATAAVTCAMCHVLNNYTTVPTICSGCHITDYNNTTNPNHKAAAWPTTCDTCHTTTGWMPANLPTQYHTFFPVNHGNANGVCSTCHQNQNDYSVFQCTNCHGGGNAANFRHPNVSGYVYNSVNCYACHKH